MESRERLELTPYGLPHTRRLCAPAHTGARRAKGLSFTGFRALRLLGFGARPAGLEHAHDPLGGIRALSARDKACTGEAVIAAADYGEGVTGVGLGVAGHLVGDEHMAVAIGHRCAVLVLKAVLPGHISSGLGARVSVG